MHVHIARRTNSRITQTNSDVDKRMALDNEPGQTITTERIGGNMKTAICAVSIWAPAKSAHDTPVHGLRADPYGLTVNHRYSAG